MKYMLDTNICIYIMKNRLDVVDKYMKNKHFGTAISVVTFAELQHGVFQSNYPPKNQENLSNFLTGFDILDFNCSAAVEYGKICTHLYKRGTPVGAMDMLIGAHAKSAGLTLVTNNVREFSRIENLMIENWAE